MSWAGFYSLQVTGPPRFCCRPTPRPTRRTANVDGATLSAASAEVRHGNAINQAWRRRGQARRRGRGGRERMQWGGGGSGWASPWVGVRGTRHLRVLQRLLQLLSLLLQARGGLPPLLLLWGRGRGRGRAAAAADGSRGSPKSMPTSTPVQVPANSLSMSLELTVRGGVWRRRRRRAFLGRRKACSLAQMKSTSLLRSLS